VAVASFLAIWLFNVSFVGIVAVAAAVGFFGHRYDARQFPSSGGHAMGSQSRNVPVLELAPVPAPSWARSAIVLGVGGLLWWAPILGLVVWLGWESTPVQQGLFFSKAAMVTFGGAYAVLPYVAQRAVDEYGWLEHDQMMAGLGLAESTPGPLIMVLQFVGFVGGWQHPGAFSPFVAALLGSVITTWVTFVPSFLFVFLGAPYVEHLGRMPQRSAGLVAITAAVVGVIFNLGMQFGSHALRTPSGSIDGFTVLVAIGAFVWLVRYPKRVVPLVLACGVLGVLSGWFR
jgi:chromate transporter